MSNLWTIFRVGFENLKYRHCAAVKISSETLWVSGGDLRKLRL